LRLNRAAASNCRVYPSRMESSTLPVLEVSRRARADPHRQRLIRRAKVLAWLGLGWHGIEATVAIGAGAVAGSIALIGFGADSVVEAVAGLVLLWRFTASRSASEDAERRAQKLIGASFYAIAAFVGVEAVRALIGGDHAEASYVGIALSVATLATMPPLAAAKARVGDQLGSSATKSEGRQNLLCAYLSAALLVGLGTNALFGWWWADPVTAIVISAVAVREGREAWRGESCCISPVGLDPGEGDCCQ
jgi:divalent metal cation (Fe/Co/Zn/Cd) transporter